MAVFLVGTLDTKGAEIHYAREILSSRRFVTRVIDAGSLGPPLFEPEIPREEVFRNAGTTAEAVRVAGNRGEAVAAAARGVTAILSRLDIQGEVEGVLGLGGSAGTVSSGLDPDSEGFSNASGAGAAFERRSALIEASS